jgi:demethylmenaquinone methyltransferase / 2-methoxy-6-polyprenyl-1,4-benzoquinol methylase
LEQGLADIHRVLRPGGTMLILEFSQPQSAPFKQLYGFYMRYVLPGIGRLISGDHAAYTYLPESVQAFPYGSRFTQILHRLGFQSVQCIPLTFGVCSIYLGKK